MDIERINRIEQSKPVADLWVLILGTLAILAGVLISAWVLPAWLPGLATSITGETPKVFWYLSRGSAMVAFVLLWASMALGLLITNRLARLWPGGPAAFDLHQYLSLLGLGFALFHATILIGDEYIQFDLFRVLTPFASQDYKPAWVGLGQVGFYVWALLVGSFYIRKQIGTKAWRWIHFSSFLMFALVILHGIASGSDSQSLWATGLYWAAGGSLLFLLYYRVLVASGNGRSRRATASRENNIPDRSAG
jgi:predicted ferric reductase